MDMYSMSSIASQFTQNSVLKMNQSCKHFDGEFAPNPITVEYWHPLPSYIDPDDKYYCGTLLLVYKNIRITSILLQEPALFYHSFRRPFLCHHRLPSHRLLLILSFFKVHQSRLTWCLMIHYIIRSLI